MGFGVSRQGTRGDVTHTRAEACTYACTGNENIRLFTSTFFLVLSEHTHRMQFDLVAYSSSRPSSVVTEISIGYMRYLYTRGDGMQTVFTKCALRQRGSFAATGPRCTAVHRAHVRGPCMLRGAPAAAAACMALLNVHAYAWCWRACSRSHLDCSTLFTSVTRKLMLLRHVFPQRKTVLQPWRRGAGGTVKVLIIRSLRDSGE